MIIEPNEIDPNENSISASYGVGRGITFGKNSKVVILILAAAAVACGYFGFNQYKAISRLIASGLRTNGSVVRMEERFQQDNNSNNYRRDYANTGGISYGNRGGHYVYTAVVSYKPSPNGPPIEFRDNVSSNPPSHRVGDTVTVLYLQDDPHSAIIDRGMGNWMLPGILFTISGVFLLVALAALRGQQQQN